jgi:hypothetical protein
MILTMVSIVTLNDKPTQNCPASFGQPRVECAQARCYVRTIAVFHQRRRPSTAGAYGTLRKRLLLPALYSCGTTTRHSPPPLHVHFSRQKRCVGECLGVAGKTTTEVVIEVSRRRTPPLIFALHRGRHPAMSYGVSALEGSPLQATLSFPGGRQAPRTYRRRIVRIPVIVSVVASVGA